ncbi:hypothetical protein VD0002_g3903 [Verticillium dahliae]|uniref:Secreted protein n=1 Tax=Verticillium dahliae TaxID=27337 RepID=A0AA44WK19_VERDA|nr:hypothetical protein BJF96_g3774 [Verticillium dahliae]PNH51781.1 hypothetical protein VD0003_g5483 [Verticillium dahliae]PNH64929.1 hypothetical protein VD0002_g3903 [Verticillium dahliae]PNH71214.1 hypothetical protein VD0001_g6347 [Verticillium dahliae]
MFSRFLAFVCTFASAVVDHLAAGAFLGAQPQYVCPGLKRTTQVSGPLP